MSNRKLRTQTISATLAHDTRRGIRARAYHALSSTPRVHAYRARAREGVVDLRLTVSERALIQALEAEGHLEGLDFINTPLAY